MKNKIRNNNQKSSSLKSCNLESLSLESLSLESCNLESYSLKIAVIDNYDSFVYNLIRYVRECRGVAEVVVMRNNQIDYEKLDEVDAILLSPGPGVPSEAGELIKVIQKYHLRKNILGICLGHQALGEFFGGKLEQCEVPLHGKSSKIRHFNNDSIFEMLNENIDVGRYHSWQLNSSLPDVLECTAITESKEVMAIKHKHLSIRGVQFHPESILTPEGRKMIQNWIKSILR